jgi:LysM repeat protein
MKSGSAGAGGLLGILIALFSTLIVAGGFILAFTEGGGFPGFLSSPTPAAVSLLTPLPPLPTILPATPTLTGTPVPSDTPAPSLTATAASAGCTPQPGWVAIEIQAGDTLKALADAYGLRKQDLLDGNCLEGDLPPPGAVFYVPYPLAAASPAVCVLPPGWVIYYVKPGDTLWNLATRLHVNPYYLQARNCLANPNVIYVGQKLFLPGYPPPLEPAPTSPPGPTYIPPTMPIPPSNPPPLPTDGNISKRTDTP